MAHELFHHEIYRFFRGSDVRLDLCRGPSFHDDGDSRTTLEELIVARATYVLMTIMQRPAHRSYLRDDLPPDYALQLLSQACVALAKLLTEMAKLPEAVGNDDFVKASESFIARMERVSVYEMVCLRVGAPGVKSPSFTWPGGRPRAERMVELIDDLKIVAACEEAGRILHPFLSSGEFPASEAYPSCSFDWDLRCLHLPGYLDDRARRAGSTTDQAWKVLVTDLEGLRRDLAVHLFNANP